MKQFVTLSRRKSDESCASDGLKMTIRSCRVELLIWYLPDKRVGVHADKKEIRVVILRVI